MNHVGKGKWIQWASSIERAQYYLSKTFRHALDNISNLFERVDLEAWKGLRTSVLGEVASNSIAVEAYSGHTYEEVRLLMNKAAQNNLIRQTCIWLK